MSSYAPLTIDGLEIMSFRNGVDVSVALLFGPNELISRTAVGDENQRWEHWDDSDEQAIHELVSTGRAVRERLDVLGFGIAVATKAFEDLTRERSERWIRFPYPATGDPSIKAEFEEEARLVADMSIANWLELVRKRFGQHDLEGSVREPYTLPWLMSLWEEADHRTLMRAVVEAVPDTSEVRIDITDMVDHEYITAGGNPHDAALEFLADDAAIGSPVIVLTEGPSDARILQAAIEVLKPHLVGYLRFPDFSMSPESNAPALVRTVKTFASAGVRNRVVAIFDNDSAAEDALRSLAKERLPSNLSIMRLPPLELASNYPTLGPSGPMTMDVNSLAGGIELYVGEDILRDESGKLRPVQWRGFVERLGRYQGEVTGKREIQDAFDRKAKAALAGDDGALSAGWTGLELILDAIVQLLATNTRWPSNS